MQIFQFAWGLPPGPEERWREGGGAPSGKKGRRPFLLSHSHLRTNLCMKYYVICISFLRHGGWGGGALRTSSQFTAATSPSPFEMGVRQFGKLHFVFRIIRLARQRNSWAKSKMEIGEAKMGFNFGRALSPGGKSTSRVEVRLGAGSPQLSLLNFRGARS